MKDGRKLKIPCCLLDGIVISLRGIDAIYEIRWTYTMKELSCPSILGHDLLSSLFSITVIVQNVIEP